MKVELINTTHYVELATTRCSCLILYTCHAIVREVGLNEFKFDEHFIKFKGIKTHAFHYIALF